MKNFYKIRQKGTNQFYSPQRGFNGNGKVYGRLCDAKRGVECAKGYRVNKSELEIVEYKTQEVGVVCNITAGQKYIDSSTGQIALVTSVGTKDLQYAVYANGEMELKTCSQTFFTALFDKPLNQ